MKIAREKIKRTSGKICHEIERAKASVSAPAQCAERASTFNVRVAKGEEIGRGVCTHVPMHHKSSVGVGSVLSIRRWGCVSHCASDSLVMKWENESDIACFCKWRRRNGRAFRSLTVGEMKGVAAPVKVVPWALAAR